MRETASSAIGVERPPQLSGERLHSGRCEVAIVEHCNIACRACSHLSPVLSRHEMAAETVFRDLSRLWEHYESPWIALLGGEPLLHRDLVGVIEAARIAAFPARVAVVTNGTLLPRMPDAFWSAIDGVQVCLYAGKEIDRPALRRCRQQAKQHGVVMVVTRIDRFRESYSELGTADGDLVQRIYNSCEIKFAHTVASGRFYKCPPAHFLPRAIAGLAGAGADGVSLDDEPDLGERLREYLADSGPLEACRNCPRIQRASFRPEPDHPRGVSRTATAPDRGADRRAPDAAAWLSRTAAAQAPATVLPARASPALSGAATPLRNKKARRRAAQNSETELERGW